MIALLIHTIHTPHHFSDPKREPSKSNLVPNMASSSSTVDDEKKYETLVM